MKKIGLLTLSVITLTSFFYCQNSPTHMKNDWKEENLKSKVKSYTKSKYGAEDHFGKIQKKNLIDKYTNKYDVKGNLIEKNCYNSDGKLTDKFTYKYDDMGNVIKQNNYTADDKLSLWSVKITNKYNDMGNLIEKKSYNAYTGNLNSLITYKYDDKGNMIEKNCYNTSTGDLYSLITYEYNDKGNMIELNFYIDGNLDDKFTYKYDDKGNEIERNFYNCNRNGASFVSKRTYKFEFDEKENWIKKISFVNLIPEDIEERKYEYYEE